MAVVTKYGNGFKDPASLNLVEPVYAEGRVRAIGGSNIAVANGDSANSLHYYGKIASNAIILPNSTLYHEALTGLSDYDLGLYKDGSAAATGSEDILADGLDLTSAGSKSAVAAIATANYHKRLWELLGLASDPGVEYDVVGTMKAAASAAGVIQGFLYYAKR